MGREIKGEADCFEMMLPPRISKVVSVQGRPVPVLLGLVKLLTKKLTLTGAAEFALPLVTIKLNVLSTVATFPEQLTEQTAADADMLTSLGT